MAKINLNVEGAFIGDTPKINLNVEGAFIGDSIEKKNPSQKDTGLSGKSPFMATKKDEGGFWGALSDTFDIGLQRMGAAAISGGATFLTKVLTGTIKGAVGEEDVRGQNAIKPLIDTLEAPSEWLLQKANEFNEKSAPKLNEAAIKMGLKEENLDVPANELLRKDVGQGFLKLGIASVTQLPQLISTVLAGESKLNQFLASASLATTQSIQEEYDKDKNVSGTDIAQSGLKGIVEGLTEMIFDTDLKTIRKTGAALVDVTYDGATSAIKNLIKSEGKKEAKEAIIRTWGGVVKEGLKGMGQEALEEGISSAAGFVIDTIDSGKLDGKDYEKLKDDFYDSMLIGGFMGGGISSIGAMASKQKLTKEQEHQVSKLQEVANDESLPTEAREVAASKIEDIKKYNFGLANDNYKLLANLPVDQRVEALNLTNRIENFEIAKSKSKTENLIAEFDLRIEDLEKKRDAIFNEYDASGAKAAAEAKKTQSDKDQEIANQFIDTNNIFGEVDNSLAPIQQRLNNNEQIDENELNKSADELYTIADRIHKDETLTPEQKNIILAPIEEQIQKLDTYELATKTTTTEITQTATTKGTREVGRVERQGGAKDVTNNRWAGIPVSVTSEDGTVTNTIAEVTPSGKVILKPKTSFNKKSQIRDAQTEVAKKPLVIDTNFTEFVESKFDEDGNVSGVVLKDNRNNTTFEVNDPVLALDIAIKEKQNKLGAVSDAIFEQVLSETPVGTKILQETKLAGRKAIPAPQVTAQTQVTPTANILGKLTPRQAVEVDSNIEQRTDNPILNTLGAQVKTVVSNAFKALKSVSPDSRMVIYDNEDSMIEGLVNEGVSREDAINSALGAGGLYNPSTGNIHINKGAKDASGNIVNTLTGGTIPHEITHAVLSKLAKENPAEFTEMINRILPFIPEPQRSKLQEFAGRYEQEGGDIQAEEFLAELASMITKGTVKFKTGHIHRIKLAIKDFIKKIADKYKSQSLAKFADNLFKNETSAQSDMKFFEDLARSIQSGQKINTARIDALIKDNKSVRTAKEVNINPANKTSETITSKKIPDSNEVFAEKTKENIQKINSKDILLSGLNGGFKSIRGNGFDIRGDESVMDKIDKGKSFALSLVRNYEDYVVVGLRLKQNVGARTVGRDGYSFAMIKDNGYLPFNIVEILSNEAVKNTSSVYPKITDATIDSFLPYLDETRLILSGKAMEDYLQAYSLTPLNFQKINPVAIDTLLKESKSVRTAAQVTPSIILKAQKADVTKTPVAGNRLFNEPLEDAKRIATEYMDKKGLKYEEGERITSVDKERAKRMSDAYMEMADDYNIPEVKASYDAMIDETIEQYKEIISNGYEVEINDTEPYKNAQEFIDDLRNNKHFKLLSTLSEFGDTPVTEEMANNDPRLKRTEFKDVNGQTLLANDLFRFVHDFFGHAVRGNSLGAIGEENAWDEHSRMYTPLARKAMTSETRGQNSYVNFSGVNDNAFKLRNIARKLRSEGRIEDANKLVNKVYEMMQFAPQKLGLLPDEFVLRDDEIKPTLRQQKTEQKVPNATAASKKAFEQKRKFDISKFPRDLQKWLLDRQVNIRKALRDAEMEFTMYALVNKAGATPLANYKFQGIYKAIYDGMTKEEIDRLDDFIFLRRVIAIDSNFDNQRDQLNKKIRDLVGLKKIAETKEEIQKLDEEIKALHEKVKEKERPEHPEHLDSNGNSIPTNKESAEQTLNSYKQSLGEGAYNKMYDKSNQYFNAFTDLLKYKFDNGLITKEEYDMYKDYNYAPRQFFDHVFGNTDASIYTTRGVSLNQDEIKGIQKGSLDYMETNSMKLLHSAMVATENKVMTNKALQTFFQEAAGKNLPFFKELNYERRKDGSIVTNKDGSLAYKGASAGFTNMIFKVDGINKGFQLDSELAKEFLDVEKWNANHKAYKLLANASGAQVLRQMATGLNVGFFISNIPIDLLSQVHFNDVYNGGGVGVAGQYQKAISGTLSTVKSLIVNDPEIQKLVLEYAQAGGLMMTQSQEGTSQSAVLGKVENALSYLGNMSEMASKLNAYKSVKERETAKYAEENNGAKPDAAAQEKINARAAFEARGAMDFHRGGLLTKYLDGFIPYLNVAFQGARITADYIYKNPVKFTNKIIQTGLGVMALTLYNMMVAGDEWDNDDLQQAKAGKLLVFSPFKNADGTHSYTEIPVPTGVKAFWNLFQNMGEGIYYKHIVNKPEKLNGALAKTLADDLAMMMPKVTTMMPPTFKAIYEYSNNKNLWTNRNITYEVVKTKDEGRFEENVLGIYKIMGKVMDAMGMDLSPIKTQKAVEDVITNPHTDIAIGLAYSMLDKFVNLIPEKFGGLSEKEKSKYSKQTIGDFAVQPISDLLSRATGTTDKKNNGKYLNIQEIIDKENKEVGSYRQEIKYDVQKMAEDKVPMKDALNYITSIGSVGDKKFAANYYKALTEQSYLSIPSNKFRYGAIAFGATTDEARAKVLYASFPNFNVIENDEVMKDLKLMGIATPMTMMYYKEIYANKGVLKNRQ